MNLPDKFQIKVNNQEESAKVQQKLFELGYGWFGRDKKVFEHHQKNVEYYLVIEDNEICWNSYLYEPEKYKEISFPIFWQGA